MEDGPARQTRSATSCERGEKPSFSVIESESEMEPFITPNNSPTKVKTVKKKVRTPSGQVLFNSVEDIRRSFLQNSSLESGLRKEQSDDLCNSQVTNNLECANAIEDCDAPLPSEQPSRLRTSGHSSKQLQDKGQTGVKNQMQLQSQNNSKTADCGDQRNSIVYLEGSQDKMNSLHHIDWDCFENLAKRTVSLADQRRKEYKYR